jgi:hypothetical protein
LQQLSEQLSGDIPSAANTHRKPIVTDRAINKNDETLVRKHCTDIFGRAQCNLLVAALDQNVSHHFAKYLAARNREQVFLALSLCVFN